MEGMRRPWHNYLLLFLSILVLLVAALRPLSSLGGGDPGAWIRQDGTVTAVFPGEPLARAGLQVGDRVLSGATLDLAGAPALHWKNDAPRSGDVTIQRGGQQVTLVVRPLPPSAAVQGARLLLKLLNVGLVALALALFWQHPRDGRAVLLGLVLLSAPVFVLPPGFRLWTLALTAHFFSVFPTASSPRRWLRVVGIYLPFILVAIIGSGMAQQGNIIGGAVLYHGAAIGYAAYCLTRALRQMRSTDEAGRPLARTLVAVAGAVLVAVLFGLLQRPWSPEPQSPLTTVLPAVLFSAAIGHLVFRVRGLEVRIIARHTLRYLLARWSLGTLFLIPGFLLVFHIGQLNGSKQEPRPQDLVGYLIWMFVIALLSGKRREVLRNLDRRFFQDLEAARQGLIHLAQELGGQPTAEAVLATLERGVHQALHPTRIAFTAGEEPAAETGLSVPIRRGEKHFGGLLLGPKQAGQPYTSEERDLLEAACIQAATAIENAHLSAALLEQQRAELAVRSAGVLSGAEDERRRLAADLHDQVLPELRQIAGEFARLKVRANGLEPDLNRLEEEVRATMHSVREVMEALRPSSLDVLGLGYALESYFRKGATRCEPSMVVSVRRSGEEPALTPDQSLALYRICQEAINNVLKHSGATRAGLEIRGEDHALTLAVWDNGHGVAGDRSTRGHGLSNIRYRADLIHAQTTWSPRKEGGTHFEVVLPLTAESTPADAENPHR
jgi:signal transduction histidine kinase